MPNRDILAIGTSAGGVEALRFLASQMPRDFPAAILAVIHLSPQFESSLDAILSQAGPLPARFAADGMKMQPSQIYLAPPNSHMLVDGDELSLGQGPRENNSRPAIDPMFRSVALCCGPRAVGAVLTGTLGDGASGLHTLQRYGAVTVVQDPGDAAYAGMPEAALSQLKPDHVASLATLPALFQRLMGEPRGPERSTAPSSNLVYEVELAKGRTGSMSKMDEIGRRSVLACPDCHGVMWEIQEGDLLRYRCHVGHAYTAELMGLALDETMQRALSSSLRAMEERIALAGKLGRQAKDAGRIHLAESWSRKLLEYQHEAGVLRDSIGRLDRLAARAVQNE